jgi:hypothetical protein
MDGLLYFISGLLSLYFDWLFFKNVIFNAHTDIFGTIFASLFALLFVPIISFGISLLIVRVIAAVIYAIILAIELAVSPKSNNNSSTTRHVETPKQEKKKPSNDYWAVDHVTEARCETLLKAVESLENTPVWDDMGIRSLVSEIKVNQHHFYDEANLACSTLEYRLIYEYRSTVASTIEGYQWLRSMGAI